MIMINENFLLALSFMTGGILGVIFFGGLWWTIRKAMTSPQPALWFFGSLMLRMSIAVAGFYFVSDGDWKRMLTCLIGFVMARQLVTWLTRPSVEVGT